MKTRCLQCRTKIEMGNTYCEKCSMKNRKEYKQVQQEKDKIAEDATKNSIWKAVRRRVLIRDSGCCRLCLIRGYIENRKLSVHHIVKRVENHDLMYIPSNLVTVCPVCHEELEKMSPSNQKILLKWNDKKEDIF
ncbi:MAG: HNH endonuclease signature motif containing protein [Bacilli bacterium]